MTREQLDALARRYLSARFDEIEARLCEPIPEHLHSQAVDFVADRASEVSTWLAHADYRYALKQARSMLPANADRETSRKLARRLLEVELEACKAELRALDGEPLSIPFLTTGSQAAEEPQSTPRFSEVVELYAQDKLAQNAWTPRSEAQNRAMLGVIGELLGNPRVGDVTKEDIRTFALTLPRLPSNVGKRFRGKPLLAVLDEIGDRADIPRLAPQTINSGFSALRAVFRWAVEHDLIQQNPTTILRDVSEGRAREQRVPFEDADIQAFFAHLDKPARGRSKHDGQPYMYWIPRILAFSGMRLGEAAQLRKADVRKENGVPVFDINVEDGKRTKNASSVRLVPVHPRLIELGFLDFVAKQPEGFLWPENLRTAATPERSPTDELSKLLMRRLRSSGVKDERKTIHSFRHTVSKRLAALSIPEYQIADILGHENESMTTGRYGGGTPPDAMLQALSKLSLPV